MKLQANLEAVTAETEQLKKAHDSAMGEAQGKIAALEAKGQEVESLSSQLEALKTEKEETATKMSELEVDILELKEAQEVLEDERDQLKNTIKTLEGGLSHSKSDIAKAAEDLKAAEERHAAAVDDLQKKHTGELKVAAENHSQVTESLQATQGSLENANLEVEKARKAADDAEEAHKLKWLEIEQAYMVVQNELTEKLATISAELEVSLLLHSRL